MHGRLISSLPEVSKKIFIYAERVKSPSLTLKSLLAEYARTVDALDEYSVSGMSETKF